MLVLLQGQKLCSSLNFFMVKNPLEYLVIHPTLLLFLLWLILNLYTIQSSLSWLHHPWCMTKWSCNWVLRLKSTSDCLGQLLATLIMGISAIWCKSLSAPFTVYTAGFGKGASSLPSSLSESISIFVLFFLWVAITSPRGVSLPATVSRV